MHNATNEEERNQPPQKPAKRQNSIPKLTDNIIRDRPFLLYHVFQLIFVLLYVLQLLGNILILIEGDQHRHFLVPVLGLLLLKHGICNS